MKSSNEYLLTEGSTLNNMNRRISTGVPICGPPSATPDPSYSVNSVLNDLQAEVEKVSVALNFHENTNFQVSSINAMKYLKQNLENIIEKYRNVN